MDAAADPLNDAWCCAGSLVVHQYFYIIELGIDQQIAGQGLEVDLYLLGGLVGYLDGFA